MLSSLSRTLACIALLSARACGSDDPPPPTATGHVVAPPAVVGASASPEHGTVVIAGPTSVDVVPHASGHVYAYPKTGITTPASTELQVTVSVSEGTRAVPMRWVERNHRYEGRVTGTTIVAGPTNVTVVLGGMSYVGVGVIVVIAPAIHVQVEEYRRGKHKHRRRGHGHGQARIRVH